MYKFGKFFNGKFVLKYKMMTPKYFKYLFTVYNNNKRLEMNFRSKRSVRLQGVDFEQVNLVIDFEVGLLRIRTETNNKIAK